MKELKKVIQKFGGINLLKGYMRTHTLIYVLLSFLINGRTKKGLELVRLGQQIKVKKRLRKRYKHLLIQPLLEREAEAGSDYVWICWFQGIEDSPAIVKKCVASIVKNFSDKKVIIVTKQNIDRYVKIPDYILKKWNEGIISNTHFSDILRAELLSKHGGIWIDSTVYISYRDTKFVNMLNNNDLFFFQKVKPGVDGNALCMSSWFLSCKKNNPVLVRTRDLLREYWKENDVLFDYYLFHYFLQLVLDENNKYLDEIPKYDNGMPHILGSKLNDAYSAEVFNNICERIPVNKLSYKNIDLNKEDTFYNHLLKV